MHAAADLVDSGSWNPTDIDAAELPTRFGFVRSPAAMQKAGQRTGLA
jgi:hypothetical protein